MSPPTFTPAQIVAYSVLLGEVSGGATVAVASVVFIHVAEPLFIAAGMLAGGAFGMLLAGGIFTLYDSGDPANSFARRGWRRSWRSIAVGASVGLAGLALTLMIAGEEQLRFLKSSGCESLGRGALLRIDSAVIPPQTTCVFADHTVGLVGAVTLVALALVSLTAAALIVRGLVWLGHEERMTRARLIPALAGLVAVLCAAQGVASVFAAVLSATTAG